MIESADLADIFIIFLLIERSLTHEYFYCYRYH